jgi:hypothetical protein
MANAKLFSLGFEPGATAYLSVQRKADGYLMDDADGAFKVSPVADFAKSMTANSDQPSLYEASEARVAWSDGVYIVCFYLQLGGSPAPTTDPMIASKEMTLLDDEEVSGGGGGSTVINDSSVTNNSTTDADLADIRKLVKAILHDNKMILDKVGAMKGVLDARNAAEKEAGSSRRR